MVLRSWAKFIYLFVIFVDLALFGNINGDQVGKTGILSLLLSDIFGLRSVVQE